MAYILGEYFFFFFECYFDNFVLLENIWKLWKVKLSINYRYYAFQCPIGKNDGFILKPIHYFDVIKGG